MAVFEVPAIVKIEIPDELDVSSGRRSYITLLTQEWLDIRSAYRLKKIQKDGNIGDSIIDVKVFIEDGNLN